MLKITDPQNGWPALGVLQVDNQPLEVALFAGPVGLSHRDRDTEERRFQNPGKNRPIVVPAGRHPLLLGLWEQDDLLTVNRPVMVSADPYHRQKLPTRVSIFTSLGALRAAERSGWTEQLNSAGEVLRYFYPVLLPVLVMADLAGVAVPQTSIEVAIEAAGLDAAREPAEASAAARARRAASTIVRDARFAKHVTEAYAGLCAMCGLDLGLVQAAHIYPASAPGSTDHPWNGLSLCANHHLAFDRHLIWVDPDSKAIKLHPNLHLQVSTNPATASLVSSTFATLASPTLTSVCPKPQMFVQRYAFYSGNYGWAP